MSKKYFGERLKERREEKELKQKELASLLSTESKTVSRQSISKWETDEGYPEVGKLLLLSAKLDISLDELFADELADLKQEESVNDIKLLYPGVFAGLETFAMALKGIKASVVKGGSINEKK